MTRRTIGVVMNGVTGRMGYRQHLVRSILALREQGGLPLADGTLIWPEPVLVGRNAEKLKSIAERHSLASWTTELDSALGIRETRSTLTRSSPSRHGRWASSTVLTRPVSISYT